MSKSFNPSKFLACRDAIIRALTWTVRDLQRMIQKDTDELYDGEIDVRLCVDGESWIIRHGDVSFDPYHSDLCAASFVVEDTDAETLADELMGQILAQHAERGES